MVQRATARDWRAETERDLNEIEPVCQIGRERPQPKSKPKHKHKHKHQPDPDPDPELDPEPCMTHIHTFIKMIDES
jgi:hypothetical protein